MRLPSLSYERRALVVGLATGTATVLLTAAAVAWVVAAVVWGSADLARWIGGL